MSSFILPLAVVGGGLIAFAAMASSPGKRGAAVGGGPLPGEVASKDTEEKLYQQGRAALLAIPGTSYSDLADLDAHWSKEDLKGLGQDLEELVQFSMSGKLDDQKVRDALGVMGAAIRARVGRLSKAGSLNQDEENKFKQGLGLVDSVFFSAAAKSENERWLPLARTFATQAVEAFKKAMAALGSEGSANVEGKGVDFDSLYQEMVRDWMSGDPKKTIEGGMIVKKAGGIKGMEETAKTLAALFRERAARIGATPAALAAFDTAPMSAEM